ALARDLVAAGDVDDVNRVVGELAAELRGEVVAPALEQEELGPRIELELLERVEVVADVFADRGVRAPAGLDGADERARKGFIALQEPRVLAGEDVVRDDAEAHAVAKLLAHGQDERGLAAPDRPADADRERALREVAAPARLALGEQAWVMRVL